MDQAAPDHGYASGRLVAVHAATSQALHGRVACIITLSANV